MYAFYGQLLSRKQKYFHKAFGLFFFSSFLLFLRGKSKMWGRKKREERDKFVCPFATWMEWIMKCNIANMKGTRCVGEWAWNTRTKKEEAHVVFIAIELFALPETDWRRKNKIHRLHLANLSNSGLHQRKDEGSFFAWDLSHLRWSFFLHAAVEIYTLSQMVKKLKDYDIKIFSLFKAAHRLENHCSFKWDFEL